MPTVLGEDGQKLSKRHGAVSVMQYEEMGYLPEALVNFLARLGWSHGDAEIFTRDELVAWFDLDGISPSPSRFDTAKLKWVNQEHMKRMPGAELGAGSCPICSAPGSIRPPGRTRAPWRCCCATARPRSSEMAEAAHYFYARPPPTRRTIAAHVDAAHRPVFDELLRDFADARLDARGDRRRIEGRGGAPRPEAAAGDDAAALPGLRHAADAGDRRRAGAAGARGHARACRGIAAARTGRSSRLSAAKPGRDYA